MGKGSFFLEYINWVLDWWIAETHLLFGGHHHSFHRIFRKFLPLLLFPGRHCACKFNSSTEFQTYTDGVQSPSPPQAVCTSVHSPSLHQSLPALPHCNFSPLYGL